MLWAALVILAKLSLAVPLSLRRAARRALDHERRFPPEGEVIDVGGVPVHALVRGRGPDVVLIHGASGNLRDFTFRLVDLLAARYRVIALDRPGLGHTGRTDSAYARGFSRRAETIEEQASLLRRAAAQLGAENPIVVGHSFGGAVALAWALQSPPAALVLLGAVTRVWPGSIGPLYGTLGSALGGGLVAPVLAATVPARRVRTAVAAIFHPDPVPEGYARHVGGALALRLGAMRANARHLRNLKPQIAAQQPRYDALRLPIEMVHGARDTIVPPSIHAVPLAEAVPSAHLTMLEGVGHMPHHVRPKETVAAIDRAAARAGLRAAAAAQ
ncbi:alpha/beta fold hydrolase [Jannaschia sp. W003]|uniref:alpha/beta fold hydrolase n=1 Tax=Jannaschia sp. W003 TaxID=2867012 RepID=UPI0021A30667|nr:alpha/beta fold hydrolase [Jannaschia sp. W003]UWQ20549.1 alpha/beta fold hydrolase [Jannaschia sp. W003]